MSVEIFRIGGKISLSENILPVASDSQFPTETKAMHTPSKERKLSETVPKVEDSPSIRYSSRAIVMANEVQAESCSTATDRNLPLFAEQCNLTRRDVQNIDRPSSLGYTCAYEAVLETVFGIHAPAPRYAISGSSMIHPASAFNVLVSCIMLLLLAYSAIVIPMELAYAPNNPCVNLPTFHCDLVVDVLFLLEIPYRCLVGVQIADGQYLDRPAAVARAYARDPWGLAFDLVTSIPFSWIDFAMMDDRGCSNWPSNIAILRLLKPAAASRHLHNLAAAPRLAALRDALARRAGLAALRCTRLFALLLVAMHYFACGFWRLKWEQSEDGLEDWLSHFGIGLYDVGDSYCLFLYFVSTTLTTVGYGDIVAGNRSAALRTRRREGERAGVRNGERERGKKAGWREERRERDRERRRCREKNEGRERVSERERRGREAGREGGREGREREGGREGERDRV